MEAAAPEPGKLPEIVGFTSETGHLGSEEMIFPVRSASTPDSFS